jgi:hypothetical protein
MQIYYNQNLLTDYLPAEFQLQPQFQIRQQPQPQTESQSTMVYYAQNYQNNLLL